MRTTRIFITAILSVIAFGALTGNASDARAEDDYVPTQKWAPYMPVFGTGTAIFLGGYLPLVAAAAPTAFRLGATGLYDLGTLGMACGASSSSSYLCTGDYGAAQLLIPIAGPLVFANNHPRDSTINPNGALVSPLTRSLLIADSFAQAGGTVLMVIGLATGHHEREGADEASLRSPRFSVVPMLGGGRVGLTATVVAF